MPRQTSSAGGQIDNRDSFNMKNNHISDSFNDYSETHCKYEFMQHPNLFLKSVQMLDVRLLPINSVESGLKVSPYLKKVKFPILMKTKIFNPTLNFSENNPTVNYSEKYHLGCI
jgi:hypothetical protein